MGVVQQDRHTVGEADNQGNIRLVGVNGIGFEFLWLGSMWDLGNHHVGAVYLPNVEH